MSLNPNIEPAARKWGISNTFEVQVGRTEGFKAEGDEGEGAWALCFQCRAHWGLGTHTIIGEIQKIWPTQELWMLSSVTLYCWATGCKCQGLQQMWKGLTDRLKDHIGNQGHTNLLDRCSWGGKKAKKAHFTLQSGHTVETPVKTKPTQHCFSKQGWCLQKSFMDSVLF